VALLWRYGEQLARGRSPRGCSPSPSASRSLRPRRIGRVLSGAGHPACVSAAGADGGRAFI